MTQRIYQTSASGEQDRGGAGRGREGVATAATATATANRIRNKVKLMAIHVAYNLPHSNSATSNTKETEID